MPGITKEIDIGNVQNDRNDPVVRHFLNLYSGSEVDEDRRWAMDESRDNRDLKDHFFDHLEKSKRLRKFKDTFILQTSRRFTEEGKDIPKPFAKSRLSQRTQGFIAEAIQEREYDFSYFYRVISRVFDSEKTDGMGFVHIGKIGKSLSIQRRELANVHFDPRCTDFNAPPDSDSSSNWLILDFTYSYRDALKIAKDMTGQDWEGKIMPGAPAATRTQWGNVTDKYKEGKDREPDDVVFHYCYDIPSDTYMVYAGGAATILQPPIAIPFRPMNIRGVRTPRFPLVALEFSGEKRGPYPLSLYGVQKDLTEPYRDMFDRVFEQLKLNMNPYVFLFSDAGASVMEQMRNASRLNDLGSIPLVLAPSSDKTKLEQIQPSSNPLDFLLQLRNTIIEELAERLGLNIQRQENVKQPFSTFERKNQFENLAIANHNEINRLAYGMIADYVVDMHRTYSLGDKNEKITVNFKDEETGNTTTQEITYGTAMKILDEWDGHFLVDTNVKIPITSGEKLETSKAVNDIMTRDSAEGLIRTPQQADMKTDLIWDMIRRADLEEQFSREKIYNFYKSLVEAGQQQVVAPPA